MLSNIRKIPFWAYLLVAFALTVNAFYIIARLQLAVDGAGSKGIGEQCIITAIRNGSPSEIAGLQIGDIIQKIGSREVPGGNHFWILEDYNAGDNVEYLVLRNGNPININVVLGSFWSQHPWFYIVLYLVILTVSITSLFILYKKPFDKSARLFFIYLQLFAIVQNTRFLYINEDYATIANIAFIVGFNMFGVVLFHFHFIFPKPARISNIIRPALVFFYSIGLILGIIILFLLIRRNLYDSYNNSVIFFQFSRWSIAWMGLTLCLALAMAIYQYNTILETKTRKQLRLVIIGSVFGLITPIAFSMRPEFIWRLEMEQHFLTLLEFTNAAGTLIMISFLVIAIFRYRMWDIETFIRKAILYTSATAIILLVYLLMVFVIDVLSIQLTKPAHFIILTISVFTFMLFRDLIQRVIDRIFQREPYDSAAVVANFEEKMAGIYQVEELTTRICQGIDDMFHIDSIIFYWKKSGQIFENRYHSSKLEENQLKEIEITGVTKELLFDVKVFSFEDINNQSKINQLPVCNLIVPLTNNNDIAGFVLLGNKLSERSYTLQDISVLTLLSHRIVALFNTAALYKSDLDRQLMLERERSRIAEDMHDDVGASLSRITMLSEIALNNLEEQEKIKPWLGQISEISREVIDEMNQIIWALNPRNDTLDGLVAFIRRFAMEFLESSPTKCTIELPENLPVIALSVEVRRNIYLVVREALHNTLKHSGASLVIIALEMTHNGFRIKIKDDGKGFDLDNPKYKGNGLQNMMKRMDDIGGGFIITSQPGMGTELELIVKS